MRAVLETTLATIEVTKVYLFLAKYVFGMTGAPRHKIVWEYRSCIAAGKQLSSIYLEAMAVIIGYINAFIFHIKQKKGSSSEE